MVNKLGEQLYLNQQVEGFLGYNREDLIGKLFTNFIPKSEITKYFGKLNEVFLKKRIPPFETLSLHKNGSLIKVEITGRIINYNKQTVAIGSIRNITERKAFEEELNKYRNHLEEIVAERTNELKISRNNFKNIFDSSSDAIFITDLEGNFIDFNDITKKRIGLTEKKISTLNLKKYHQEHGVEHISNYFNDTIKVGKNVFSTYYINTNGDKAYIELSGTLIKHKNNDAILHVSRDITKRQEAEKQKLNLIIQTEEKERKRFAKDLHDGLGATLSASKMYLNIVKREKPGSERALNMLKEAILLIDDAGKVAKEIAINIRPHDLSHFGLAKSLQNFCERLDSIGSISVSLNTNSFDTKLDEEIELNLFRTINELINNTLKYADAKIIKINLHEKNNKVIIEYTDDGKGFDFKRMIKSNKSGTGLDNIIQRAKLINGDIQINSEPGKGMSAKIIISLQ